MTEFTYGVTGVASGIGAELAAFLLSPASSWIKGTDVAVDGGMGALMKF